MSKKKKKVTFTPEAQTKDDEGTYLSATKLSRQRPQRRLLRSSPIYTPGPHACPPNSSYVDTSQFNFMPTDISNPKLFISDDDEAFSYVQIHSHDLIGEQQGIVGLHPLANQVFDFVQDYIAQSEGAKEELKGLIEKADIMVVLINEVEDVNLLFSDISDEEEDNTKDEDEHDKGIDNEGWTCLRECLV
jgi:hypothetical protein